MMAIFKIDRDELVIVAEKMQGIKLRDITFRYDIVESYEETDKYLLLIYDKDKDKLHKRAMWIREKVFNNDRFYYMKDKNRKI